MGMKAFEAQDFESAELELENVLLMAPGHPKAHELLIETYAKIGALQRGERLLSRARRGGLLSPDRIRALKAMLQGPQKASLYRGSLFDGRPPSLPPPGALTPSGRRAELDVAALASVDLDTGVEDLFDELESDGLEDELEADVSPSGGGGTAPDPVQAPSSSSPEALHAFAVGLFSRTGSALKAGPHLVEALRVRPDLLAEADGGLFDATYKAFRQKIASDSKNLDARWLLAFLEEKRNEFKEALVHLEAILDTASPGSELAKKAKDVKVRLEAELKAREIAARPKPPPKPVGGGPKPTTPKGDPKILQQKGKDLHSRWQKSQSSEDLDSAEEALAAAIRVDGGDPENHYYYALVKIDQATMGETGAREAARKSLSRVLALRPKDAKLRRKAESLLRSLSTR